MTELEQNRIFGISYEMRGLAATLVAASRGDIQDPERVIEFAAGQVDRLAGKNLALLNLHSALLPSKSDGWSAIHLSVYLMNMRP